MHRTCTTATVSTLVLSLLVPSLAFAVGETPSAAGGCPTGTVLITAATRAQATAAGIPESSNCWDPKNTAVGAEAGDAKRTLRGLLCPPNSNNYGGAGPEQTIEKLNPAFAGCAAKFLSDAKQRMPSLCLREGYRTVEKQQEYAREYLNGGGIACTKGAGCEHPSGIAIDVNVSSEAEYMRLWNDATQYGLIFYLRSRDKVHFVPIAARNGSRSGACLTTGYTPGGQSPYTPNNWSPYGQSAPLGYGQPIGSSAQGPCPTGYVFYNSQCYALNSNQPLGAAQQPFQYTQQPQQMPIQSSTPSIPSTPGSNVPNTTGQTSDNTFTQPTTTPRLDLVDKIINGTATDTTSTSSTFTSDALQTTGSIWNGTPASDTLLSTSHHDATNTLSYAQPTPSLDTFSTADIGTAADYTATSSSQSFLRVVLENLRRRLVYLLEVLGLMRRGAPADVIRNLPQPQLIAPAPGQSIEEQYGGE